MVASGAISPLSKDVLQVLVDGGHGYVEQGALERAGGDQALGVGKAHGCLNFFQAFRSHSRVALRVEDETSLVSGKIHFFSPASSSWISLSDLPDLAFHSMRPLALRPMTTAAAVDGALKL